MANDQHLEKLRRGVDSWNRWRDKNHLIIPDLSAIDVADGTLININFHNANLSGANLSNTRLAMSNLVHADLRGANLNGALLADTDLQYAKLNRASLRGADLGMANLSYADLTDANISGGSLYDAVLINTNLSGADLSGVGLGQTTFTNNNLSSTKGLNSVIHHLPSSIGIDTIYKSNGAIPDDFLRGAGVPDDFIIYARTLRERPVRFYSCFISYSSKDQRFCNRLHSDLQANGIRTWYFPEDARWGGSV